MDGKSFKKAIANSAKVGIIASKLLSLTLLKISKKIDKDITKDSINGLIVKLTVSEIVTLCAIFFEFHCNY